MKKFFTRNNTKINNQQELHLDLKEEKKFSTLSDKSISVYSSNNVTNYKLEEYYYVLLNCIIKGLNKNFINVFQKMQKKIDINQQIYEGNTLLIFSSKEGNFAISKYLCSQGADVNIQNDSGNTALHYAIANQFFSIVDILKASGAKEDIVNNKGYTPWDCIEHGL
jgi:ankyrin repeat protein